MAVSLLRRLAADAPTPVYAVAGRGGRDAVRSLRLDDGLDLVASPRHATVLLVVGAVSEEQVDALRQVHDQVGEPRGAVWWSGAAPDDAMRGALPDAIHVQEGAAAAARRVHRALLMGERPSSAVLGPGENPTDWQGVGPHGQGGKGMMGGTPYGRSMAMTGEDIRDGLQLDRVPVALGPFHAALPHGVVLDVELQGDVVVDCTAWLPTPPWLGEPIDARGMDPTLAWVADLAVAHGLPDRARRLLGLDADDRSAVSAALGSVRRALRPALQGVAVVDGEDALARLDRRLSGDRGAPDPAAYRAELDRHLPGMEWSEAVTAVWSLR